VHPVHLVSAMIDLGVPRGVLRHCGPERIRELVKTVNLKGAAVFHCPGLGAQRPELHGRDVEPYGRTRPFSLPHCLGRIILLPN
jgi:hypothetical protein